MTLRSGSPSSARWVFSAMVASASDVGSPLEVMRYVSGRVAEDDVRVVRDRLPPAGVHVVPCPEQWSLSTNTDHKEATFENPVAPPPRVEINSGGFAGTTKSDGTSITATSSGRDNISWRRATPALADPLTDVIFHADSPWRSADSAPMFPNQRDSPGTEWVAALVVESHLALKCRVVISLEAGGAGLLTRGRGKAMTAVMAVISCSTGLWWATLDSNQ